MQNIDALHDILSGRKRWEDLTDAELMDVERYGGPQQAVDLGKGTFPSSGVPYVPKNDQNINKIPEYDPANPVSAQDVGVEVNVQKQPLNKVESTFPQSYFVDPSKIERPIAKSISEMTNPIMGQKENLVKSAREQMMDSGSISDLRQKELSDLSKKVADMPFRQFGGSIYDQNMKSLQGDYEKIQDPQRDMMSQAILSLGPALLGGLTGESGAIAAPKAGQLAQAQYEQVRKEDIVHNEKLRDNLSKRIDALSKMKEQDIKLWESQGKNEMELLKNQISAAKDASKAAYDNKESDRKTYEKEQSQLDSMYQKLTGALISGESSAINTQSRIEATNERSEKSKDRVAHQKTLDKLDRDPNLKQYTANLNSIEQARSILNNPKIPKTAQMLEDIQQTAIRAMGLKGTTALADRKKMDMVAGMVGVKGADLVQALESKPRQVDKSTLNNLVPFFKRLFENEKFVTNSVVDPILNRIAAGNESMYERNPDLKQDLMNKLDAYKKQFSHEVELPKPKLLNKAKQQSVQSAPKGMSFEEFKKWKAGQK